ncbi:MAG: response regulator transcription factor [Spirochaetia bacterium]|jgi:two-component system phosphate regulon response regulator PhoB|nr:response regulator transcription factor [Spirochaetia bacterium]
MKTRILVVEDELDIQELIAYQLQQEGFKVIRANDGEEAIEKLKEKEPDCMILDLMLPRLNGLEVLKIARYELGYKELPILIASARSEESDIITGLELGADDYLTKPFSAKVLTAKVKARLRHEKKNEDGPLSRQGLTMDPSKRECTFEGTSLILTASEFNLLLLLFRNEGRVFTRDQLISSTKGEDYPATERSIDVQIASLRKKLGTCGKRIRTVWGIGYKYSTEEET